MTSAAAAAAQTRLAWSAAVSKRASVSHTHWRSALSAALAYAPSARPMSLCMSSTCTMRAGGDRDAARAAIAVAAALDVDAHGSANIGDAALQRPHTLLRGAPSA